ncbi:MAG TPA: 30S ribosomal protein S21 [Anaerovoracaceae bacterium]|nr:30S ribosomal protein S21 [Anaerovoracaceae bacterium]
MNSFAKNDKEVVIKPLEVQVVNNNFEEAFRRFKALVQKEKVISLYKERQAFEKPSVRKRRKSREAVERKLLAETREQQIISGEWDKRQKRKEIKRKQRQANHQRKATESKE